MSNCVALKNHLQQKPSLVATVGDYIRYKHKRNILSTTAGCKENICCSQLIGDRGLVLQRSQDPI